MSRLFTVFGGTGFLGSRVVRHLLDAGHRVRVAARHPQRDTDLLRIDRASAAHVDLRDAETLSATLAGVDGAVNATSLYLQTADLSFEAFHVDGAARLARLAAQEGVQRLIHVSGIGADPDAHDPYIRARGRGEAAVRAAFGEATIVRPSVMFGPDDAFVAAILAIARRSPVYPLFGQGATRLQPVHVDDVATAVCRALQARAPAPCYELAGPKVYTYRELVREVSAAAGLNVRLVPMPFAVWRGLAAMAERLPGAPLTRTQVALVEKDNVTAQEIPGLRALDVMPRDIVAFVRERAPRGTST